MLQFKFGKTKESFRIAYLVFEIKPISCSIVIIDECKPHPIEMFDKE